MKLIIFPCIVLLSLAFSACKVKQPAISSEDEKKREATIISEGYIKAKVVNFKDKDGCGFVLENTATKELFSPISWPTDQNYKVDGALVWVKYRISRSSQEGCFQSKPIVIDEIKMIGK